MPMTHTLEFECSRKTQKSEYLYERSINFFLIKKK